MKTKDESKVKGGKARAAALTPEKRSEIAKNAAKTRWGTDIPKAECIGELKLGDSIIQCAVLPDGKRLLSQRGVGFALGRKRGGSDGGGELPFYMAANNLKPFISKELLAVVSNPITYHHGRGGGVAFGIDASVLPKICDVWLRARDANQLLKSQVAAAQRADILMRALAEVAIVALVDEATGYQDIRARNALANILEAFIEKELQPWTKTFPESFYQEIFRLRGWSYKALAKGKKPARPGVLGTYTNNLIYERLAPGIYEELQRINPKKGKSRKSHHHRWFTTELGHPKLAAHIEAITALAKASKDWDSFMDMVKTVYPKPSISDKNDSS